MLRTASLLSLLSLLAPSCALGPATTETGEEPHCTGKCDGGEEAPQLCVAIRGNGPAITSHFGALARIVEHYGPIDAAAGGSSASISTFLIESIQMNPYAWQCGDEPCSADETAARLSLLFKSLRGYFEVLASTDEAAAVATLARIKAEVDANGIDSLLANDPSAGVEALETVLSSPELRDLVNPEVIDLLSTSPDPVFHARDIVGAIAKAASFQADDPTIFVRPGVVSFPAFIDKIGRVGSFYAGYAPVDAAGMQQFLAACATPGRGLSWGEIATLPAGDTTCGELFHGTLAMYRAALLADPSSYPSRVDEPIGGRMPALITTSVLTGGAVTAFEQARASYLAAQPVAIDVDFDDVRLGYWGRAEDLARVGANPNGYTDLKTSKFLSLGDASWREALSISPAEPGLSRALEMPNGLVSTGGWSDLHPVLALANLGCDRIVYVTRRGADSRFLTGVMRMLGISAEDEAALLDLGSADSSFSLSIAESSGVWCTDWDTPPVTDLDAMFADGYDAPFETSDPAFTSIDDPYERISERLDIPGCSPGAVARQ